MQRADIVEAELMKDLELSFTADDLQSALAEDIHNMVITMSEKLNKVKQKQQQNDNSILQLETSIKAAKNAEQVSLELIKRETVLAQQLEQQILADRLAQQTLEKEAIRIRNESDAAQLRELAKIKQDRQTAVDNAKLRAEQAQIAMNTKTRESAELLQQYTTQMQEIIKPVRVQLEINTANLESLKTHIHDYMMSGHDCGNHNNTTTPRIGGVAIVWQ